MINALNVAALLVAFALSLFAFGGSDPSSLGTSSFGSALSTSASSSQAVDASGAFQMPDGSQALLDATGQVVPLRPYRRIAAGSIVADTLLLEFASPEQIIAFTHYQKVNPLFGFRFEGKPQLDTLKELEALLVQRPDLLIVSSLAQGPRLDRLREAGVTVFVLEEMRGVESYLNSARKVAALLGRSALGELHARSFQRRLSAVAQDVAPSERKTALQLVTYGNQIYGSGRNTSYSDVLRYAGLDDLGSHHFQDWPKLTPDQVLTLDPQVFVTRDGMGKQLCGHTALSSARACDRRRGQVVELPDAVLNDPGASMLLSAELIHEAVYGTGR